MLASLQLKVLSVRLPELQVRRIKSLAATRGVSVQEAVHQALEVWASQIALPSPEPLDSLQGSLAEVDIAGLMRQEKQFELSKDRRRQ